MSLFDWIDGHGQIVVNVLLVVTVLYLLAWVIVLRREVERLPAFRQSQRIEDAEMMIMLLLEQTNETRDMHDCFILENFRRLKALESRDPLGMMSANREN